MLFRSGPRRHTKVTRMWLQSHSRSTQPRCDGAQESIQFLRGRIANTSSRQTYQRNSCPRTQFWRIKEDLRDKTVDLRSYNLSYDQPTALNKAPLKLTDARETVRKPGLLKGQSGTSPLWSSCLAKRRSEHAGASFRMMRLAPMTEFH